MTFLVKTGIGNGFYTPKNYIKKYCMVFDFLNRLKTFISTFWTAILEKEPSNTQMLLLIFCSFTDPYRGVQYELKSHWEHEN